MLMSDGMADRKMVAGKTIDRYIAMLERRVHTFSILPADMISKAAAHSHLFCPPAEIRQAFSLWIVTARFGWCYISDAEKKPRGKKDKDARSFFRDDTVYNA